MPALPGGTMPAIRPLAFRPCGYNAHLHDYLYVRLSQAYSARFHRLFTLVE